MPHCEFTRIIYVVLGPNNTDAFISNSTSQAVLEKMLSVGISSWVSALNDPTLKLCKNVTYEADADETGSGCGKGPIPTSRLRRKVRRDDGAVLWERGGLVAEKSRLAERCLDNCDPPTVCHYEARMCSAPNEISKSYLSSLHFFQIEG
jgi:hypothetical protein